METTLLGLFIILLFTALVFIPLIFDRLMKIKEKLKSHDKRLKYLLDSKPIVCTNDLSHIIEVDNGKTDTISLESLLNDIMYLIHLHYDVVPPKDKKFVIRVGGQGNKGTE